ncbi:hypothetical protein NOVOSPHI9U_110016 [Novosphingobium sp. 9U]|nr:hypothetical protein NOVOSPHI9U_110016 [Novosphingobium sp. 9U]
MVTRLAQFIMAIASFSAVKYVASGKPPRWRHGSKEQVEFVSLTGFMRLFDGGWMERGAEDGSSSCFEVTCSVRIGITDRYNSSGATQRILASSRDQEARV